jgi:predicted nuclease of predicted toxin-antitoxin system
MRFLGDMGVSTRTIAWLRKRGHDAVHLRDQNLQRLEDPDILAKARGEERVLLTMDLDFGYLVATSQSRLPSVILFRLSDERSEVVNARLVAVLLDCQAILESGAIVSVGDTLFRVRSLPLT